MIKIILSLLISFFVIFPNSAIAQNSKYYKEAWKKVDKMDSLRRPKSAYSEADKIYVQAKKDKNYLELIKALSVKYKYSNDVKDKGKQLFLNNVESELKGIPFPYSSIMHNFIGNMFFDYLTNYTHRIKDIEITNKKSPKKNIAGWNKKDFYDKIDYHYSQSLKDEDNFKKLKSEKFKTLFYPDTVEINNLNLYELLAKKALEFYFNKNWTLRKYEITIENNKFFNPAKDFVSMDISGYKSKPYKYRGLYVLQQFINNAFLTRSKEILVRCELHRFKLMYSSYKGSDKKDLYIKALKHLEGNYDNEEIALVLFTHARFLFDNSEETMGCKGKEKNYYYRKTAHKLCEKSIKRYKKSVGAKRCQNMLVFLNKKYLYTKSEKVVPANKTFPVHVEYRNVDTLWVRVWKNNFSDDNYMVRREDYKELKNRKLIATHKYILKGSDDHNQHSTEILVKGLDSGIYVMEFSTQSTYPSEQYSISYLSVSDIFYTQRKSELETEIRILNRKTGKPIERAKLTYWTCKWKKGKSERINIEEKYSDKEGRIRLLSRKARTEFFITYAQDTILSSLYFFGRYYRDRYARDHKGKRVKIFTDRAIYRPGDKVHFKAILYSVKDDDYSVVKEEKIKLKFRDNNYNVLKEMELRTNEYGSISGTLTIPYSILTGNCTISTDYGGNLRISVEEYKAPKFEVKTKKQEKQYKYDDKVFINARALTFNNVPVSESKYEYKIYRIDYDSFRPYYSYWNKGNVIFSGKGITDKDGKLEISFLASKPSVVNSKKMASLFSYEISVTDINGETQKVEGSFRISFNSLFINTNLKENVSYKQLEKGIRLYAQNIEGVDIPSQLKVELIKLKGTSKPLAERLWKTSSCRLYTKAEWNKLYPGHVYENEDKIENYEKLSSVASYTVDTEKTKTLNLLERADLSHGPYMLKVTTEDKDGKEVKYKKYFTLYKSESKINPYSKFLWAASSHKTAQPGETVVFTFGSSVESHILYEIVCKDKLIKSGTINLNNQQQSFKVPIQESYRGGMKVVFYSVYDNRCYEKEFNIDIPYNNKKLDITYKSFRDKLLPGEKESWTIRIKDYRNNAVNAEMVATLYDASLDKLKHNSWDFNPYKKYYNNLFWEYGGQSLESGYFRDEKKYEYYSFYSGVGIDLPWESLGYGDFVITGYSKVKSGKNVGSYDLLEVAKLDKGGNVIVELMDEMEMYEDDEIIPLTRQAKKASQSPDSPKIKVRKDFSKTAFFYPFLRTNKKGEVEISFTIPETLTRWKMLGVAHGKDLSLGFVEKYLETRKDLMVISNAPRFLREGDKIEFTTKLSNLSKKDLNGEVKIELQDAITGEYLDIIKGNREKVFKVIKNGNSVISWTLNIPRDVSLIKYTVTASSGNYTDGESNIIPVLSKRIMVTKSMPFSIKEQGENLLIVPGFKKILNKKTVEPYRMTMEFSSNPVWYAVQSLPYLMEYPYECSEQLFSRYFANKLASNIIDSNPEIRKIYDLWKSSVSSGKETFMSNLSRNKDLKQIVLQETPWVAEAKTQEERMERLGMLFDLNNMKREEQRTYDKLLDNQNRDGGWPWFKDMRSNRFITQHILTGLGYLSRITENKNSSYPINRALKWAKAEFIKSYNSRLKENDKDRELRFIDLHFLYMATFYKDMKISLQERVVINEYLKKCEQYWKDASLYEKGLAALVLYRHGKLEAAREVVTSLKEYATTDSYYGMYWKENTGGIYVHKAQIEIQSLMIEVFSEITDDKKSVQDMKIWLLNHKRTNSWESTKATVCAIYSLLSDKEGSFDMDKSLKVTVGNKIVFDASKSENIIEAGTGYVRKTYQKDEISKDMDLVKIRKSDDKLVWGATYLQYFDELDKVTESSTGLQIKKQILVERIIDGKVTYEKVEEGTKLSVGDKLKVMMDIKNDFPMEYVHIKDLRASCLEPGFIKSGYGYKDRLFYYISVKDASVNYFIDYMPKGEFTLSYELRITHKGSFSNGISTIQCMYAPEFQSNSKGDRIEVGE